MMLRIPAAIALLITVYHAGADADPRYDAVMALGKLNGVALNCRYLDQVQRMKAAVVESAPKERSFGLAFDQATNDGFLSFISESRRCPGPARFEQEVEDGIEAVKRAFATR